MAIQVLKQEWYSIIKFKINYLITYTKITFIGIINITMNNVTWINHIDFNKYNTNDKISIVLLYLILFYF